MPLDDNYLPPKCPVCGKRFYCLCSMKNSKTPWDNTPWWSKKSEPEPEPEPEPEFTAPPGTIVVVIVPLSSLAYQTPEQVAYRINQDLRYKADQIFIQKDSGYETVKDRIGDTLLPDYLDEKLRQGLRNLIGDE